MPGAGVTVLVVTAWSALAAFGAWATSSAQPFVVGASVFAGMFMGMATERVFRDWPS